MAGRAVGQRTLRVIAMKIGFCAFRWIATEVAHPFKSPEADQFNIGR
jgi:hypothetical protein